MDHLDELIEKTQQLVSVMNDMEGGIISTRIHPDDGTVEYHCGLDFFLKTFSTFDVKKRQSEGYPVGVYTEMEGIHFQAILNPKDLHRIEDHLPEGWFKPIEMYVDTVQVNLEPIKNPSARTCE